jgi:hypothetical protein
MYAPGLYQYICIIPLNIPYSLYHSIQLLMFNIVARTWRLYKTGIGLTTGFIRSHTVTHKYSVYTLQLRSSLYYLPSLLTVSSLVSCLPIPQDPFACNSSLKTAASL